MSAKNESLRRLEIVLRKLIDSEKRENIQLAANLHNRHLELRWINDYAKSLLELPGGFFYWHDVLAKAVPQIMAGAETIYFLENHHRKDSIECHIQVPDLYRFVAWEIHYLFSSPERIDPIES